MNQPLKRLIPVPFWAAVIGSIAILTRGDLGMDDRIHFGMFGITWLLVILTVLLSHVVFIGPKAEEPIGLLSSLPRMQIPLSIVFVLATIAWPIFGIMYGAASPPTSAAATPVLDFMVWGAAPYLIAIIVTLYAGLEKVVEDSHQEEILTEGSGFVARTVDFFAKVFRSGIFVPIKIVTLLTIGRDGRDDYVEESSTIGMLLTVALYVTFTAVVFLHYRAFSTTTFNYSFLELSSWDIFLFSLDNIWKSLFGDFPDLLGWNLGDAIHDSSNVFFTVLVGIFRFFLPIALLLLIMGKKKAK